MSVQAVSFLSFFMCAPDYHPSSTARFKRSKTVKVKKFPLFKNLNKTPLFRRGHTVTTARPFRSPRNAQRLTLSKHPFIFLFQLPYILVSNPHPNLIRTSFCRVLKRKKKLAVLIRTFPSTAPCAQLLQKSRGGCRVHGKPSRRALSSDLARCVA